jgi:hypothetical protein
VGVRLLGGAFEVSKGDTSYIFENDGWSLFVTDLYILLCLHSQYLDLQVYV